MVEPVEDLVAVGRARESGVQDPRANALALFGQRIEHAAAGDAVDLGLVVERGDRLLRARAHSGATSSPPSMTRRPTRSSTVFRSPSLATSSRTCREMPSPHLSQLSAARTHAALMTGLFSSAARTKAWRA